MAIRFDSPQNETGWIDVEILPEDGTPIPVYWNIDGVMTYVGLIARNPVSPIFIETFKPLSWEELQDENRRSQMWRELNGSITRSG